MTQLELMLRDAATAIDWPPTPEIATAIVPRIRAAGVARPAARAPRRFRLRRPLAIALAALLVLAGGAAAIPAVRDPVLDFLGLRGVEVKRVPQLPFRTNPGARLGLAPRLTLAQARRRLAFRPLVPAALPEPAVYVADYFPGGQLGLVYRSGRLLLTEVEGALRSQYLQKFVLPGTKIDRVVVAGQRGIWIHGQIHEIVYVDANGEIRPDRARLAGDTLLWRHGRLLLRLEGARSEAEALRIARSVRAAP